MSPYLHINIKALKAPVPEPVPSNKAFRLYARCDDTDPDTCSLFYGIHGLASAKDRKAALAALVKLVHVAASGQPFAEHYDNKQCHETHRFHYEGKARVIWRVRKGDIRIPFYYHEGRAILLTNVFTKRKDKLSNAEKNMIEKEVKSYIDLASTNSIRFIERTDNECD